MLKAVSALFVHRKPAVLAIKVGLICLAFLCAYALRFGSKRRAKNIPRVHGNFLSKEYYLSE